MKKFILNILYYKSIEKLRKCSFWKHFLRWKSSLVSWRIFCFFHKTKEWIFRVFFSLFLGSLLVALRPILYILIYYYLLGAWSLKTNYMLYLIKFSTNTNYKWAFYKEAFYELSLKKLIMNFKKWTMKKLIMNVL